MKKLKKDEVIAASSSWVATALNIIPGLGTGYIYQRRWKPYFLTTGAVVFWFILGIILQGDKEPSQTEQIIGLSGLLLISIVSAIYSFNIFSGVLFNKFIASGNYNTSIIFLNLFGITIISILILLSEITIIPIDNAR